MNPLNISTRIRLAILRTVLRAAGYVLHRALTPTLKPAPASRRTEGAVNGAKASRTIDGEFRRIDPRHNNSW